LFAKTYWTGSIKAISNVWLWVASFVDACVQNRVVATGQCHGVATGKLAILLIY